MSHYDSLFGDGNEVDNENDGKILSEDEGQPDNDGEGGDDIEAGPSGDEKPVKLEPKQRTVRNPRNTLNIQRLCGPRGIADLETYFKGIKFRGKGHETEDLDAIMKRMQHWAHRMYPKYNLDDSLRTIERLGRKKQMHTYMNKYRLGMLDPVITNDADDDEDDNAGGLAYESNAAFNQQLDPLDSMIEEQLAISRAANTSGVADLSVSECNFDAVRDEYANAGAANCGSCTEATFSGNDRGYAGQDSGEPVEGAGDTEGKDGRGGSSYCVTSHRRD